MRRGLEFRFRLPLVAPVELDHVDLPVDPYTAGAFIANGHAGTSAVISTPDPAVIDRLVSGGGRLIRNTTEACPRVLLPKTIGKLRDLGLAVRSAHKRIPALYLHGSVAQRIELLQGMMDGDGSGSAAGRSCVSYSTTSPGLAADLAMLVCSLGGSAKLNEFDRRREGRPVEYTVSVMLPRRIEPFFSGRKHRGVTVRNTGPARALTSIEAAPGLELVQVSVAPGSSGAAVTSNRFLAVPLVSPQPLATVA